MNAFQLTVGKREITSLVMDEAEFAALCDLLDQVGFSDVDPNKHGQMVDDIRQAQHLPLMAKGTRTEPVFRRYAVATPYLSACVRGFARRTMAGLATVDQEKAEEVLGTAFAALPRRTRKVIRRDAQELSKLLAQGGSIEAFLAELTRKYVPDADDQLVTNVQRSAQVTLAARGALLGDPLCEIDGYFRRLLTGLAMLVQESPRSTEAKY